MTASKIQSFEPRVVLPGDDVTSYLSSIISSKELSNNLKIGRGLIATIQKDDKDDDNDALKPNVRIEATQAGMLTLFQRQSHKSVNSKPTFYVRSNCKRYVPSSGDRVIGIVEERFGDCYKVNIFGPNPGILPVLAFEGATKRNKPNLQPGSLVYCRVVSDYTKMMDPELSCKVEQGAGLQRKDWMTDESTYGVLGGIHGQAANNSSAVGGNSTSTGQNINISNSSENSNSNVHGTCIRVSMGLARELLKPKNLVLNDLGSSLPYEIAIGVNGMIWVDSTCSQHTILICNAIKNSEVMTPEQTRGMVKALVKNSLIKS